MVRELRQSIGAGGEWKSNQINGPALKAVTLPNRDIQPHSVFFCPEYYYVIGFYQERTSRGTSLVSGFCT